MGGRKRSASVVLIRQDRGKESERASPEGTIRESFGVDQLACSSRSTAAIVRRIVRKAAVDS